MIEVDREQHVADASGGTDMAALAAAFADLLRRAGVPVSVDHLGRFVRAIPQAGVATVEDAYWVARVTLVTGHEHIDTFDRVFDQVFRGLVDPADARGDPSAPEIPSATRRRPADTGPRPRAHPTGAPPPTADTDPATTANQHDDGTPVRDVVVGLVSGDERLATTDFAELSPDEVRDLYELMRRIRVSVPERRARRHRRHRRGDRLDLRATIRRSRRSGGDPVDHVTRRARRRPRKLVVLCDISGSMAPYSRASIQLLHAASGASGAEVFTFGTRLTRLTRVLAVTDPDVALTRAAAAAPDWKGGTRIGTALKVFVDEFGRRGVARGATVVIVSDGWDRDDPAILGEQMARLARLAHRVVWINPRRAAPGFAPLAGGMAAALPYCDALVSGHTLVALGEAMASLADDG